MDSKDNGFAGVTMASLGSDLVFGFQQVLFDLIILFFEGLGILDIFLAFLIRLAELSG